MKLHRNPKIQLTPTHLIYIYIYAIYSTIYYSTIYLYICTCVYGNVYKFSGFCCALLRLAKRIYKIVMCVRALKSFISTMLYR